MMSQGSKNSAGRSSDAAGPESMLLFPRPGGMSLSKLAAMSESSDSATGATSSTVTAPQPGLIPIRPSLLNPRLPHTTANQATVARGTGASQNGAGNSAASPLNSQSVKKEQTGTDVLNVKQQFDQLQLVNQSLANTKEKTPMCLINELARFNKVQHQYTLVDEQGPAHKKTFFVKLKLGEEEYSAEGASIKKAQHAAASAALDNTKLKHPPPKPARFSTDVSTGNNLTPTVELNALAMKRGEPAVYKPVEAKQPPYYPPPNFDFRGMYNQRYHYPRMPRMFYTSLKVGPRMFFGDGPTRQAARHVAANKALKMLRYLPLPNQSAAKNADAELDDGDDIDEKDQLKSEISLVHEIALKNNVEVVFEVIRESGPPHMKLFVTQCRVGDLVTEAQGNSKKLSKKKAAEEMLDKLQDMRAAASASQKTKPKLVTNKKKSRNLIKVDPDAAQKADVSYGVGINPISRLIQIMQAQKKKEPLYSLLTERGLPRRREFVMQVCVDDKTCTGVGPNKKLAKRCAAEAMLQLLGFSQPTPQPTKPALKSPCSEMSPGDKKVTFCDADDTAVNGQSRRQLMPGLLFLRPGKHRSNGDGSGITAGGDNCLLSSIILKNSDTRPEQQLLSVVEANNIKIDFDDFSGKECLCRVTLSSHPNDSVHGTGTTRETARDAAALQALRLLASTGTVVLPPATGEGDATGSNQGAKVHTNDGGKPVALEST